MNKEEVKGGAEKVGGKVKEQFGKLTGNPVTQMKGKQQQAEGQMLENAGKLKDAVEHPKKHLSREASDRFLYLLKDYKMGLTMWGPLIGRQSNRTHFCYLLSPK